MLPTFPSCSGAGGSCVQMTDCSTSTSAQNSGYDCNYNAGETVSTALCFLDCRLETDCVPKCCIPNPAPPTDCDDQGGDCVPLNQCTDRSQIQQDTRQCDGTGSQGIVRWFSPFIQLPKSPEQVKASPKWSGLILPPKTSYTDPAREKGS